MHFSNLVVGIVVAGIRSGCEDCVGTDSEGIGIVSTRKRTRSQENDDGICALYGGIWSQGIGAMGRSPRGD
jgi:hypothetical protein